jgi:hypothetical protein
MDKTIAFLSPQLCERGTTVALYDYALAHEKAGGISIILYSRLTHKDILIKFQQAFQFVIQFQTMAEVEKLIAELKKKLLSTQEQLDKELADLDKPTDMGDDVDAFDEEADEAEEFSHRQNFGRSIGKCDFFANLFSS